MAMTQPLPRPNSPAYGRMYRRLGAVPASPGVYHFKGPQGEALYVGKAANLRNRLRSYFGSALGQEPKIRRLMERAADFEFTVTESEAEALLLENLFIKKHKPRYNARLKDDKTYPYIKIDLKEAFPQVYITRRVKQDGARYFGPFASAGSVRKTLDLLKKLFPYRSCTKVITGNDDRPCLEYFINRCVAPCVSYATKEQYQEVIQQVIAFMDGRTETVVRDLKRRMRQASDDLEFERAARLRDQIHAIERVNEGQKVASLGLENEDAIALARGARDEAWVEVFTIRRGSLVGRDHFIMEGAQDTEEGRLLAGFVKQYYDSAPFIPPRVLLQTPLDEEELPAIQHWLSDRRGRPVRFLVPQRGEKRRLLQMVEENARQGLAQLMTTWATDRGALNQAMANLAEELSLPDLPRRMECYDISNTQGAHPVGSMVVFQDGQPQKAHYRRFQVKGVDGPNDYAMMQEMLRRRFRRLSSMAASGGVPAPTAPGAEDQEPSAADAWNTVPNLVIIDGGKGHLSAAQEVFLELGINFIPLSALAKEREELFMPDLSEPILLPRTSPALYLVQRIRDEAHRFAISYHQRVRSRKATQSVLDVVPGIGPRRKRMLLRQFGGLGAMREASVTELAAVPGMTTRLAQKVKEYL